MIGHVVLVLLGLGALLFGSDRIVEAGRRIALRYGVSDLVVGLTVASVGTSLPELATTSSAALQAHGAGGDAAGLAAGNIVGSNLFLLGGLLGATGLVAAFRVDVAALRRDGRALLIATLAVLLAAADGRFGRVEGLLLVSGFVAWVWVLAQGERGERVEVTDTTPRRDAGELLGGLIAVVIGAEVAVDHGVSVATLLGVPGAVVGIWVGIGTSLPELVVSLQAARRGASEIAFGNVIGSSITNLTLCVGGAALFSPLVVEATVLDAGFLVVTTLAALLLLSDREELSRPEGGVLVMLFGLYLFLRMAL